MTRRRCASRWASCARSCAVAAMSWRGRSDVMKTSVVDQVIPTVMRDEAFRSKPYRDTKGILTAGYGTNLEEGFDADEAMFLLEHRLSLRASDCLRVFPWF